MPSDNPPFREPGTTRATWKTFDAATPWYRPGLNAGNPAPPAPRRRVRIRIGSDASSDDGSASIHLTRSRPAQHVTLFILSGRLDSATASRLRLELLGALRTSEPTVVVDLSDVDIDGTTGAQILQETLAWAQPWHLLRVVTGSRSVDRLLRLSGLADDVELYPDLGAALHSPGFDDEGETVRWP